MGDQTTGTVHTRDEEEEEDVAAGARETTRDPSAAPEAATTTASTVVSQDTYLESAHRVAAAELVEAAEAGVAVGTRGRETETNTGTTNGIKEVAITHRDPISSLPFYKTRGESSSVQRGYCSCPMGH